MGTANQNSYIAELSVGTVSATAPKGAEGLAEPPTEQLLKYYVYILSPFASTTPTVDAICAFQNTMSPSV